MRSQNDGTKLVTPKIMRKFSNNNNFRRYFRRYFHGMTHAYVNHICDMYASPILLHMSLVQISPTVSAIVFCDDGSTVSIITKDLAKRSNLKGKETMQYITFASKEPELTKTMYYQLKLKLNDGSVRALRLLGLDKITTNLPAVDVEAAYDEFPEVPYGCLDRPAGPVEILHGQDAVDLLPDTQFRSGMLRALSIPFGSGWTLGGYHPDIKHAGIALTNSVQEFRTATFGSSQL